jgi:CRISPR-associated protein Cas1
MITKPDFMAKKVILVFTQNKEKISFKNDNLVITKEDGTLKFQISCYNIFSIFIVGGITLTSGIISRSKKFGFSIVLFTPSFKVNTAISFILEGNFLLREKQYTTQKGTEIAKQIIINKIENQRDTIKKIRNKEDKDGIKKLNEAIKKLKDNDYSTYEIMGLEGTSAKVYFNRIFAEFNWKGRQPRVKRDELNLLLDIGYTVLFNYIEAILNLYGFDIYKGNLHKEFYKRKSLVCDIIEPFRPLIDYKIRKMIKLGQIKNYQFKIYKSQYQIEWEDSSQFIMSMLSEINENKEKIFDYIQKYYRWFMKDGEIEKFPKVEIKNDNS